ncbi:MAG: hypothetical protein KKC03_09255 [Bacteroidetes bacterium]|nr:hypothetical protein [Bacteroidota bacterium]
MNNNIKNRILGPVMIPGKKMLRYHDEIGFYELVIPAEAIEFYRNKFHSEKKENRINIQHEETVKEGVRLSDSFLIDSNNRQSLPLEFQDLPNGTWMIEYTFENPELLIQYENNGMRGFSVEGKFTIEGEDGKKYTIQENFKRMNKLSDLLSFEIWVHGGGAEDCGRKEHGEAHFELKEKNTRRPLGKITMPSLELWLKSDFKQRIELMTVQNKADISKKDKKGMVRWLELNDNENLLICHKEWNESNKDNKRTTMI